MMAKKRHKGIYVRIRESTKMAEVEGSIENMQLRLNQIANGNMRGVEARSFLVRLSNPQEGGLFRPEAKTMRSLLSINGESLDTDEGKAAFDKIMRAQYHRMAHDCFKDALEENLWDEEAQKYRRRLDEVLSWLRLGPQYVKMGKEDGQTDDQAWEACGLDKDNYMALFRKRLFQETERLHTCAQDSSAPPVSRYMCMREISERLTEIKKAGYEDSDEALYERIGTTKTQFEKDISTFADMAGLKRSPFFSSFRTPGPA
jgi:hypothetical protein